MSDIKTEPTPDDAAKAKRDQYKRAGGQKMELNQNSTSTRRQPAHRRMKQPTTASMKTNVPTAVPALTTASSGRGLANSLGWVSLALGLSELVLTRPVAQASGLDQRYATVLRAFGLREMTSGVGLLTSENKQAWMWSRVVGDLIDGGFLAYAYAKEQNPERRKKIVMAFATISPIVALDLYNAFKMTRPSVSVPAQPRSVNGSIQYDV